MSVSLECKKIKRTGFLPAFLGGGILAAAVPVINMVVRSEMYLNLPGNPIQILLDANWQMMTMLNVLLVVAGACLLYHTEYADNAMQKMKSLPVRESSIFLGKAVLTIFMSLFVLAIEAGAVAFCTYNWFEIGNGFFVDLCLGFVGIVFGPESNLIIAGSIKFFRDGKFILLLCPVTAAKTGDAKGCDSKKQKLLTKFFHPFVPPLETPAMILLRKMRNRMISGSEMTTTAAIIAGIFSRPKPFSRISWIPFDTR